MTTAREAIAMANECRMRAPNMLDLLEIITKAATLEGDEEAFDFLWLCHWKPTHPPN